MKKKLLYLIVGASFLFSCASNKKYNAHIIAKHSPTELKEDLAILKTSLEEGHPGLYWYFSKRNLDFKFDSINSLLTDSITSLQFYRMVAPLVAYVKCGHTILIYPGIKYNKAQRDSFHNAGTAPLYQINYYVDSNKIFVKSINNKDLVNVLNKTEILTLDNISAKEIIQKTKNLFGSDGYNQNIKDRVLSKAFLRYYYSQFDIKDSVTLQLQKINKPDSVYNYVIKKVIPAKSTGEVKKLSKEEIKKEDLNKKIAKKKYKKNKYKGYDWDGSPILSLTYDTVLKSTAIMKVKSFSSNVADYNKFFKESFKELKDKNIQNLILDLRDNVGGKLSASNNLFRYLYNKTHQYTGRADMVNRNISPSKYIKNASFRGYNRVNNMLYVKYDSLGFYGKLPTNKLLKPLENSFTKNLIVLINGLSFSATSLLAANLQEVNRGVFIGEETGGGYNKCTAGIILDIDLPNTKLRLNLPLKVLRITNQRNLEGRGVFPQYPISETIQDVLAKNDVVMEKAKELINKN